MVALPPRHRFADLTSLTIAALADEAFVNRRRSRSSLARPFMERFSSLRRLTCPSA